jgi:translation initiation factor 4A
MRKLKLMVGCMHGKIDQQDRNQIMEQFRTGTVRILVTTDLLARGIDVYQVGVVINFDLPKRREEYIHRIGRSGRFGRRGLAINLITKDEGARLIAIAEFYSTEI